MTKPVVDELEIAQIDEKQGQVVTQTCRTRESLVDTLIEQDAIGQSGQQIMVGLAIRVG
jgi:hypothetical protein